MTGTHSNARGSIRCVARERRAAVLALDKCGRRRGTGRAVAAGQRLGTTERARAVAGATVLSWLTWWWPAGAGKRTGESAVLSTGEIRRSGMLYTVYSTVDALRRVDADRMPRTPRGVPLVVMAKRCRAATRGDEACSLFPCGFLLLEPARPFKRASFCFWFQKQKPLKLAHQLCPRHTASHASRSDLLRKRARPRGGVEQRDRQDKKEKNVLAGASWPASIGYRHGMTPRAYTFCKQFLTFQQKRAISIALCLHTPARTTASMGPGDVFEVRGPEHCATGCFCVVPLERPLRPCLF